MRWWHRIPYTWRLAFGLWLGMRVLLWGISAFLFYNGVIPLDSPFPEAPVALDEGLAGALFGSWLRWDGGFYYWIVTEGYTATPTISAFFPLYPLLAKLCTMIGFHPLIALILISNLALLGALKIFLEEVSEYFDESIMLPAGLALLVFPGAFFFYAPYPMSLALLLVLLSVRFTRKNKWLAASLTGFLSGLTHSTVIPLSLLLLLFGLTDLPKTNGKLRWISLLTSAMPLAGVVTFLAWRIHQGFPSMANMLDASWGSTLLNPLKAIEQLGQSIMMGNWMSLLKTGIILIGLFSVFWLFRQRKITLAIYQTGLLLYLISFTVPDHPLGSFIRYFLLSFPVYMTLGAWMKQKTKLRVLVFSGMGILNLFLCSLFMCWYFVA